MKDKISNLFVLTGNQFQVNIINDCITEYRLNNTPSAHLIKYEIFSGNKNYLIPYLELETKDPDCF